MLNLTLDDWYDRTSPNNGHLKKDSCLRYLTNSELTSIFYAICGGYKLTHKEPEYIRQELQAAILQNTQNFNPEEETLESAREFVSRLPLHLQFATIPEIEDAQLLRELDKSPNIKVTKKKKKAYEREPLFPQPELTEKVKSDTLLNISDPNLTDKVEVDSGIGKEGGKLETKEEEVKSKVSRKVKFFENDILKSGLENLHLRTINTSLPEPSTGGTKLENRSKLLETNDRPKYIFERGTAVRRRKSRLGSLKIKHTFFQQAEDNNIILESIASISSEAAELVQTFNKNRENKREETRNDFDFRNLFFKKENSDSRESLSTIHSEESGSSGSITDFLKIEYPKDFENEALNTSEREVQDFDNTENFETGNNHTNMNFGALLRPSIYRHGPEEDIKTFLDKFENEAEANEWTDDMKLKKIKIAFDGPAHDIYIGKVKGVPGLTTWLLMKAKLEEVFKRSKTELKEKLKQRTYKGENDWSEYMLFTKRIVREINPLASDEKIIKKIIQGLPLKERDFILREKPQTMHALDRAFLSWLKYKESMEEGKGKALETKVEELEKHILQLKEEKQTGKVGKTIGNINRNGTEEEPLTLSRLLQTLQNNPELLQNIQNERVNSEEVGNDIEINFMGKKGNRQQGRNENSNYQRDSNNGYQGQNRGRNTNQGNQNNNNYHNYNNSDRNYQGNNRGNYRGRNYQENRYQGQNRNYNNYNQQNENNYRNNNYNNRRYDDRRYDDRRYNDRRGNDRNYYNNRNERNQTTYPQQNMHIPQNSFNFSAPPPQITFPTSFHPPPFQPPPFFGQNGNPNQGTYYQKN